MSEKRWNFTEDHKEIERYYKQKNEELKTKKSRILSNLTGQEAVIGTQDVSLRADECCSDYIQGTIHEVTAAFLQLKNPQPREKYDHRREELIELREIRTIKLI